MLARAARRYAFAASSHDCALIARLHRVPATRRALSGIPKPRIADRSVWDSIIPRAFRERKSKQSGIRNGPSASNSSAASQEWNPATFFIVIFLIIGSNAINLIAVRTGAQNFSRKAEARISVLKDAIERVHRGESVNVGKLLGSEDEAQEQEWEEVMREIEAVVGSRGNGRPESVVEEKKEIATPNHNTKDSTKDATSDNRVDGSREVEDAAPQPRFY